MDRTTTYCPRCNYRGNADNRPGTRKLRCPRCAHVWPYSPPVSPDRMIEVPFQCAVHDKPFTVELSRAAGAKQFRITRIFEPDPWNENSMLALCDTSGHGSWGHAHHTRPVPVAGGEYRSDELDFSGFMCAVCGCYEVAGINFVRCGRCKTFTCSGRIIKIQGGGFTFKCSASCGYSGRLEVDRKIGSYAVSAELAIPQNGQPEALLLEQPRRKERRATRARSGIRALLGRS